MKRPSLLLAAALLAALWPVWVWYARRMGDGSDEPWGIAALAAAALLMVKRGHPAPLGTGRCLAIAAGLGIYALGYSILPPLGRAMIAVSVLAVAFAPRAGGVGIGGLLLLSLPVLATMQFYLGYPLRVLTAGASSGILTATGLDVTRTGLTLWWRGESVSVDAPCSGIRMLWGGLVLACGLCAWRGSRPGPTLRAVAAAFVIIVAANVLRATLLFYKEAHVVRLPAWTHAGIGCACFALALLVAALAPLRSPAPSSATIEEPPWPASFGGRPLRELPLSEAEARFAADFPGRIKRFTDGRKIYILRWVARPTRKLHPAADCFRGLGYAVAPRRPVAGIDGREWGCFTATRGPASLRVAERIWDAAGNSWTDVPAWFWAAALGRTSGPWWAMTEVR